MGGEGHSCFKSVVAKWTQLQKFAEDDKPEPPVVQEPADKAEKGKETIPSLKDSMVKIKNSHKQEDLVKTLTESKNYQEIIKEVKRRLANKGTQGEELKARVQFLFSVFKYEDKFKL